MDFDLSEEQRLLKDNVERLVAGEAAEAASGTSGWSRERWAKFAELGLLALPFAEEDGGLGLGAVETMLVMEAFGRGLVREPYLATVVICGGLLRHGAEAARRAELAGRIAAGEAILAFAHGERETRFATADVRMRARRADSGFVLDGVKTLVPHGDRADLILASARTGGERRDPDGITLFVIDPTMAGVTRRPYALVDGTTGAEIGFEAAELPATAVLGEVGGGLALIERVVGEAVAALCAEAVGVMGVMCELTTAYLKERRQFGRPIGSFQALQHRAADMYVALEEARSMAIYATMMRDEPDPALRSAALSAAKVVIGRKGQMIGREAVQLHGGIGMTMEYRLGAYFKRMTAIDLMFGDADHHLARVAEAGGLGEG